MFLLRPQKLSLSYVHDSYQKWQASLYILQTCWRTAIYSNKFKWEWGVGMLEQVLKVDEGQRNVYDGFSFLLRPFIIVPFNKATAGTAELQFNTTISGVWTVAKCNYRDL